MNHKLANGMKMWKRNGNTTTLLFSQKRLEIVYQERRGQVKTMVMEHFNGILFHKSGPANKQHTNQTTNQNVLLFGFRFFEEFSSMLYTIPLTQHGKVSVSLVIDRRNRRTSLDLFVARISEELKFAAIEEHKRINAIEKLVKIQFQSDRILV